MNAALPVDRPATLRDRLPALSPAQADFAAAFFRCPRRIQTQADDTGSWTFRPSQGGSHEWAELVCADQRALLTVHGKPTAAPGARPWWEYQGESRLLAWTLAHQDVLTHLNALLSGTWQIKALYQWQPLHPQRMQSLDWTLQLSHSSWQGCLVQPIQQARDWLAQPVWATPQRTPPEPATRLPLLPVQLALQLAPCTQQELSDFAVGDIFVAGLAESCWQHQLRCRINTANPTDTLHWVCQLAADRQQVQIASVAHRPTFFRGDIAMTTPDHQLSAALNGSPAAQDPAALCRLPLAVSVELAQLALPIDTLSQMQPGFVIPLDQPVDACRVRIRVQDQHWATGELVVIGDYLGIRLLECAAHGSEYA